MVAREEGGAIYAGGSHVAVVVLCNGVLQKPVLIAYTRA